MIINCLFYNAANDAYLYVEPTYLVFNADGTISFYNEVEAQQNLAENGIVIS